MLHVLQKLVFGCVFTQGLRNFGFVSVWCGKPWHNHIKFNNSNNKKQMNPPKKITTTPTPPPPPNYHFPQPCKIPSFLFANILQAIWYLLAKNLQIYFKIPKFSSQILPVFSCHSSVFQQYITVSFFIFQAQNYNLFPPMQSFWL